MWPSRPLRTTIRETYLTRPYLSAIHFRTQKLSAASFEHVHSRSIEVRPGRPRRTAADAYVVGGVEAAAAVLPVDKEPVVEGAGGDGTGPGLDPGRLDGVDLDVVPGYVDGRADGDGDDGVALQLLDVQPVPV